MKPGFDGGLPKAPVPAKANVRDPAGTGLSPDPFGLHAEALGELVGCQQPFHVADGLREVLFMVAMTIALERAPAFRYWRKLGESRTRTGCSPQTHEPAVASASSSGGKIAERASPV